MTAQQILETKLTSVGLTLTSEEITMLLDEVNQAVLNYTNLDEVPEQLRFVVANMALDLARHQNSLKPTSADDLSNADVDSIKIGDTSIKLGGKGSVEQRAHTLNVDDVVMNYRAQLNQFRRMVWS